MGSIFQEGESYETKEKVIIETAIKLFAKKDTVLLQFKRLQRVPNVKGAFYIYFKSKEALLLSVLHYYYERIFTRIQKIKTEHDNPRDVYRMQLVVFRNIWSIKSLSRCSLMSGRCRSMKKLRRLRKMRRTTLRLHIETSRTFTAKTLNRTAPNCAL
ncbi:TetR/AcrR family transcriptional regulator [Bacillus licheniformis]|nr:TetR/AcrR family transcriptional regulator [Bacillus licheniformis]